MKRLIVFLLICGLAVGISIAVVGHQGIVQIFLPPNVQVSLSLNFALLLLLGLFFLLYVGIRFVSFAFGLPNEVRRYRLARRKKRARFFLNEAIAAMLDGRYAQSVKAALKALEMGEKSGMPNLIAARSAYHVDQEDKGEQWFNEAEKQGWLKNAVRVSRAGLFIDARNPALAEKAIDAVPDKERSALAHRLLIKSLFMQEKWGTLLALLRTVDRRSKKSQIVALKTVAVQHLLADECLTSDQLTQYWRMTPDDERSNSTTLAAFVQNAVRIKRFRFARDLLENRLNREWDSDLARLYGSFCDGNDTSQIECAEKWLEAHPKDANLLFAIGWLCAQKQLWGKARNYLEASLAIAPSIETRLALAQLLDQLKETDDANQQYRQIALDLDHGRRRA